MTHLRKCFDLSPPVWPRCSGVGAHQGPRVHTEEAGSTFPAPTNQKLPFETSHSEGPFLGDGVCADPGFEYLARTKSTSPTPRKAAALYIQTSVDSGSRKE